MRVTPNAPARWLRVRASLFVLLLTILAVATPAVAQTVAITGGKVFPVSGPPIDNGTVLIVDGTITAVGANIAIPANATRIDARGKWVTPGLINASTRLGLVEIDAVDDTNDASAGGDRQVAAGFRSWDGLNPASILWAPARNDGITSVVSLPGGGLIAGQAALVDTREGDRAAMLRKAPVAMVINFGEAGSGGTRARGEMLMRLRELLVDARTFAARRDAFENAGTRSFAAGRMHLDALADVLAGKMPVLADVDRAADIATALDLAAEFKFRLIINGGAEAWQLADRLAKERVVVLTGALANIPSSFATLGARQENAAILRKAGVPIVLTADRGETFRARTIRQHAGNAVAYGLPWDEALRALTLAPAEAFGVADAVGTLQPGRDANVVVWDGDPFEFTTHAVRVLIRGRDARTLSREDLLTARYARKQ
ncbi:MAG: amidohydrolase family protein [Acidobacteriota bacterium]